MVMKKDGRKRDIKSKLVAAVCMLLVSCIMMVSSTYAWFTLSTAPEVTGITTAIGANGNLEMALLNKVYENVADALAGVGDSTGVMTDQEANLTWGNLVKLGEGYGLDKITLYPAKLNAAAGVLTEGNYLGTPQFGADGRWNGGFKNTSYKTYNGTVFADNGFGVRAVGTASGMSALETAYRSALSTANTALQNAIAASKTAVSNGGSSLASMAVGKATATDGNYTVSADQVTALVTAYTNIETALDYMETALRNYIIADYLSGGSATEESYAGILTAMEAVTDLSGMKQYASDSMDGYVDDLVALQSDVATRKSTLSGMTAASYPFDDIKAHISALADLDKMLLNGYNMTHWMEKGDDGNFKNLGALVSQMSNLVMEVNAGANPDTGIFAQMADFVDTFTTEATISGINYQGISADNLKVNMKVNATANPAYLNDSKSQANTYTDGVFVGGGSNLTDFYGYILDMAFRTNAVDSDLMLQTEGVDRVYADNESNPTTMGGGSTMIFTVPAGANFPSTQMVKLMSFIRVVFFDPANGTIFGYARLDSSTALIEQETDGTDADGYTITMELRMWDVTLNPDDQGNNPVGGWAASQKIVDLVQNTATAVSSLVYLDGETLTNADVSNINFTGKMNLQFSSSAELKPMEYGDLRTDSGEAADEDTYTVKVNNVQVPDVEVAKGASYSLDISSYLNGQTPTSVVVTMGGNTVENAYDADTTTISVADVSGDIEVTINFT